MSALNLLTYSLSSFGLFAFLYKFVRFIRAKQLSKTYFRDKTILITGASSGLGKSLAEELYPLGAQLIICARSNDELVKLKQNLMRSPGKEPEILNLDVSSKLEVVKPKIDALYTKFHRIDILINNAGVSYRGDVNINIFDLK
jgi:dehydrogenase/reductase SDR family protein 7B